MIAFSREEYKEKIDKFSDEIIQNWCLKRYYSQQLKEGEAFSEQIYYQERNDHFSNELKFFLGIITKLCEIKNNYLVEVLESVIREVFDDNNYNDASILNYVIIMKFKKEGINTECKNFRKIIKDCIASFDTLIHLMAAGDLNAVFDYVDTI